MTYKDIFPQFSHPSHRHNNNTGTGHSLHRHIVTIIFQVHIKYIVKVTKPRPTLYDYTNLNTLFRPLDNSTFRNEGKLRKTFYHENFVKKVFLFIFKTLLNYNMCQRQASHIFLFLSLFSNNNKNSFFSPLNIKTCSFSVSGRQIACSVLKQTMSTIFGKYL